MHHIRSECVEFEWACLVSVWGDRKGNYDVCSSVFLIKHIAFKENILCKRWIQQCIQIYGCFSA